MEIWLVDHPYPLILNVDDDDMTSDKTQIQIFADWPVSHAKCVTKDNRKSPESCRCRDDRETNCGRKPEAFSFAVVCIIVLRLNKKSSHNLQSASSLSGSLQSAVFVLHWPEVVSSIFVTACVTSVPVGCYRFDEDIIVRLIRLYTQNFCCLD